MEEYLKTKLEEGINKLNKSDIVFLKQILTMLIRHLVKTGRN